jgi:DNA repair exonuclease SbcCD nuclease subunit
MNNEILFFADLHLHERKEFNRINGEVGSRLQEGISILEQIADVVKVRGIKNVVFLGDVFELKDRVPNHIQIAFGEALHKIDAMVFFLVGNHDFKIKKYPNVKVLALGDMIELVERPRCIDIQGVRVGFIPYYREYEDFKRAWKNLHGHNECMDIVCFHQFLPGISYKSGHKIPGRFDLPMNKDTQYISGHLHQSCQVLDNKVRYLGSPYQVNFGEGNEDKYIYLYDIEVKTFHPWKLFYPEFKTIDIYNELPQESIEGNYIKLVGELTPDKRELVNKTKSQMLAWGAAGVTTDIRYMREVKKRIVSASSTPHKVISEFVGGMSKALILHLDKQKLIGIGENLLQEAKML